MVVKDIKLVTAIIHIGRKAELIFFFLLMPLPERFLLLVVSYFALRFGIGDSKSTIILIAILCDLLSLKIIVCDTVKYCRHLQGWVTGCMQD